MRQSNERGFLDAHLEQSFKNVPNDYKPAKNGRLSKLILQALI